MSALVELATKVRAHERKTRNGTIHVDSYVRGDEKIARIPKSEWANDAAGFQFHNRQPALHPAMEADFPTQDERWAGQDYAGAGAYHLNEALRAHTSLDEPFERTNGGLGFMSNMQEAMSSYLKRSIVREPMTIYREANFTFPFKEGDVFEDEGWVSTTHDFDRFHQFDNPNYRTPLQFKIRVPPGSHAIDMNYLVGWDIGEAEIVLPPGSRFRITSVRNSGTPLYPGAASQSRDVEMELMDA